MADAGPGRVIARACGAAAGTLLVLAFATAHAFFGGRSLGWVVLACAAASALAAALLALGGAAAPRSRRDAWALAVPALALVAVAALGALPLPAAVTSALSPVRAELHALAGAPAEAWPEAARRALARESGPFEAGQAPPTVPLSFDAQATAVATSVLACWMALLLAVASLRDERLALRVIGVVVAMSALGAAYAVAWEHAGNGRIYGFVELPPGIVHRPFGSFFNKNHAAGLYALLCPVALAAVIGARSLAVRAGAALALVPLSAAVLEAGSRGGLIAGGVGAVSLGLMLARSRRTRVAGLALAGAAVLAVGLAFTVFAERLIDHSFDEAVELSGSNLERARIYRRELRMAAGAPALGTGVGAFVTAQNAWKDTLEAQVPLHGESDWLEVLVEGGVPWLLAWLALVSAVLGPPLRRLARGEAPALLAGLCAGSLATLAHAAVDFHHREPSVALASLLLAATARAWSRRLDAADSEQDAAAEAPDQPGWRWALGGGALAAAGCVALAWPSGASADREEQAARRLLARREVSAALGRARRATELAPRRAEAWALRGAAAEMAGGLARPGEERDALRLEAVTASARATALAPSALGAARRAGQVLLLVGADEAARHAARVAVRANPGLAQAHRLQGQVLVRDGRLDAAIPHLAAALEGTAVEDLGPQQVPVVRMLHEAAGGRPDVVFEALRSPWHRAWYVVTLERDGHASAVPAHLAWLADQDVAALEEPDVLTQALAPSGGEQGARLARALRPRVTEPAARQRIAIAFLHAGELDEAAAEMDALVAEGADDAGLWYWRVEVESRRGDVRAALDQARRGLARFPGDPTLVHQEGYFARHVAAADGGS